MARIAKVSQLQRVIPSGSAPIAQRTTGDAGAGFEVGSKLLAEIAQRKTKDQLAKADMNMSIALSDAISAYDDDPDYATHGERYIGESKKTLGEIASTIQDGAAREAFVQQYKPMVANGLRSVTANARTKEIDFEQGQLLTDIDRAIKSGSASGDIATSMRVISQRYDAAVESGYMKADDAAQMKIKAKNNLAIDRLKVLPPEQRIEALRQPWAKNLPPGTRAELMRDAEDTTRNDRAQLFVDDLTSDPDLPREDAMVKIATIKNADDRETTERRYDYIKGRQEKAIIEERSGLLNDWFDKVALEGADVRDIPEGQWDALGYPGQQTLINAQASSAKKTRPSYNVAIEDNLNQALAAENFTEVREIYIENAAKLSDEQNKRWSRVSTEGVVPIEIKGLFGAQSTLKAKVPNYSVARRGKLQEALGTWYEDYQETYNKLPDDKVVSDKTDQLILEFDTSWWLGTGTKAVFEMTPSEKVDAVGFARSDDKELFDNVMDQFKLMGVNATDEQFLTMYGRIREKRKDAAE